MLKYTTMLPLVISTVTVSISTVLEAALLPGHGHALFVTPASSRYAGKPVTAREIIFLL
jgi:hypothetical protein